VPRALLCEGCAEQISIALQPDGRCRISFTPHHPTGPSPAGASTSGETPPFVFTVEVGPVAAPSVMRRPTPARWRSRLAAQRRPIAQANPAHGRCFVFNGNEYCE
jgi:hypothetical protein